MAKKSPHPEWALACKRKGTELRHLNGSYYLYEVTSKWDRDKKRSKKITGKLLGKITQNEGFLESDKNRLRKQQIRFEGIQVKECGIAGAIEHLFVATVSILKKIFPDSWQILIAGIRPISLPVSPEKHDVPLFQQFSFRAISKFGFDFSIDQSIFAGFGTIAP